MTDSATRSHQSSSQPQAAAENEISKTPKEEASSSSLVIAQTAIVVMIAFITFITVKYCTSVYFNREEVLTLALSCSQSVLGRHQVQSWIQNGTLLGCRRISRFVVWDADLDIGVYSDNADQLTKALDEVDAECFGHTSSVAEGARFSEYRTWRKCNKRICALFHETAKASEDVVVSGDGKTPASTLFPLQPCALADVTTQCPADTVHYLVESFGNEWLNLPLRLLFD